jgi:hypothetical protein
VIPSSYLLNARDNNNQWTLQKVKMNNRAEIIHVHTQIIHFSTHENSHYSFLSVGGHARKAERTLSLDSFQ